MPQGEELALSQDVVLSIFVRPCTDLASQSSLTGKDRDTEKTVQAPSQGVADLGLGLCLAEVVKVMPLTAPDTAFVYSLLKWPGAKHPIILLSEYLNKEMKE